MDNNELGRSGADAPSGSQASPEAASASSPTVSIPNAGDWFTTHKAMVEAFENHPFWRKAVGTPLATDLPVRAANVAVQAAESFIKATAMLAEDKARMRSALLTVVNAVRDYLPPDGTSADDFINRVIGAVDNPEINPLIAELENGRS